MLGIVSRLIQNKNFNDTKKNMVKTKLVNSPFSRLRKRLLMFLKNVEIVFIPLQAKLETQNMNASPGNRNSTNQLGGVPTM